MATAQKPISRAKGTLPTVTGSRIADLGHNRGFRAFRGELVPLPRVDGERGSEC